MGVEKLFYLHAIQTPGAFLTQLDDVGAGLNVDEMVGYAAGHADPLFRAAMAERPDVTFTTPMLATILAGGLYGTDLTSGDTYLYYKRGTNKGNRYAKAATEHFRVLLHNAYLYWMGISAGHRQTATVNCRIKPLTDVSGNSPWQAAGSLALPVTAQTASEFFTMGPVKIGSTFLKGLQRWDLNLGLQLAEEGADGEIWDSHCGVDAVNPVLSVTGCDLSPWADYGGGGAVSVTAYLLKKQNNGNNYGAGTSNHIKLTGSAFAFTRGTSRGGRQRSETSWQIGFTSADDATAPLTLAFNQAVT